MKIMVTWQLHQGKLQETLAAFSKMTPEQDQALMGSEIKMIGRWHDLARGRGVAIFECASEKAFAKYALNWNGAMDLDVGLVLDDAEVRAMAHH